jgi:uncharacterized membrane protein
MSTIEQSVEVEAPLSTVYNQWTQFEEFPRFMQRVEEVRQLDDTHLHWVMDFMPEGIKEKLGDALGAPDRRVKGDLERFKDLIESRGAETGGWRGEVKRPDEV